MLALVVGNTESDPLLAPTVERLAVAGHDVRRLPTSGLASAPVSVRATEAFLERDRIDAVLFRASPSEHFAHGFTAEDNLFASAETRALWVHLLSLDSVSAVNRADCDTWFVPSPWFVWRRRLEREGVPVSRMTIGATQGTRGTWLQWAGGFAAEPEADAARCFGAAILDGGRLRQILWLGERPSSVPPGSPVDRAAHVLAQYGVRLAAIQVDEEDSIAAVSTHPRITKDLAKEAAARVVEALVEDRSAR